MNREKTLLKNTMIITIGKICTQCISFLLLPLYTSILTTEEYGIVDLVNTLTGLLIPIITLQIENALFRFLIDSRDNEKEKSNIIISTLIAVLIQTLIFICLYIFVRNFINNNYKDFLIINILTYMISTIMLQMSRGLGDNLTYTIGSFLTAVFTIIFNIIFLVIFKFNAYGMILASCIAHSVTAIYIFVSKKIYNYCIKGKVQKTVIKKLLSYSIPLIPNALSWWIFNSSDRIIVNRFIGISANGILAISNKFSNLYIIIYNIFNLPWTETASVHIKDEDRDIFFNKTINIVFRVFLAMCFGIIVCMPIVFPIMVNIQYVEAYKYIPILMLAALGNVVVGLISVIYVAQKDTKSISKTSIYAALINIIVHVILIKFIGLYAAAISTLAAYLAMSIYRLNDVKKYIKIKFDKSILISALMFGTYFIICYYINNFILNIINILFVIIYAIFINRNSLNIIKDVVFQKVGLKRER